MRSMLLPKRLTLEDALFEANLGRAMAYYTVNDFENSRIDFETTIRINPKTF